MFVKQFKIKQKNKGWFMALLLCTSGPSLLRTLLTGKGHKQPKSSNIPGRRVMRPGEWLIRAGEGTIRAGQDF